MFGKKKVGLDIADHTIEVIYLTGNSLHTKILGSARVNLEPGIVEMGRIKDEEKLASYLKLLFSKAKPKAIPTNNIIFGLPDSLTYIHVFTLESHNKKEREDLIKKEIETSIPDSPKDLIYSYRILKQNKEGVEILLAVVNREAFSEWYQFFKKNKFEVETFDIEALAIFRDLYGALPKEPVCVVDIGAEATKINIFDKEGLHFNYSAMTAGNTITKELAVGLKLEESEAESFKIRQGLVGNDAEVSKIIKKNINKILKEIKDAIKYFESDTGNSVSEVVLVGGSSLLGGVVEYASEKLGLPAKLGKSRILEKKISLEYIEAVGLALRGLGKNWDKKDPEIVWDNKFKKKKKVEKKIVQVEEGSGGDVSADDESSTEKKSGKTKFLLIILLVVILILAGAVFYQKQQKTKIKQIMSDSFQIIPVLEPESENIVEEIVDEFFPEDLNLLINTSSVTNTEIGVLN